MIGIIVDGRGDFAAMKARFPRGCKILKTDGPRGHSVSIRQLVSAARKQVRILGALRCKYVILLFDFECRAEMYPTFMEAVEQEIEATGFPLKVYGCAPNRMIENWYLADIEELSGKRAIIRDGLKQKHYEGHHGKDELKKLLKPGVKYNEVDHGAELFSTIRFQTAVKNSDSFADFLEHLPTELV